MEQFMKDVRFYASCFGIKPATVIQKAGAGGGATWKRWVRGESSPTQRTLDKVRAYIAENPPPESERKRAAA
ncbi:XRE family transcriptional regulator [Epibacterium sp. Ofav1-8]|nr:XRE family transcriptional regulator [Epibacterium sp. Ofav1-8]